jgi:hypothetical protein
MPREPLVDLVCLVAAAVRDQPVVLSEALRKVRRQAYVQEFMSVRIPVGVDTLLGPVRRVRRNEVPEGLPNLATLVIAVDVPHNGAQHSVHLLLASTRHTVAF